MGTYILLEIYEYECALKKKYCIGCYQLFINCVSAIEKEKFG